MRVLLISGAFPPHRSGEATNTIHLCRRLAESGLDVYVITNINSEKISDNRIKIYPVMQKWSWDELPLLTKTIIKCSPDAIILIFIGWIYDKHPMITFIPKIVKIAMPKTTFITRFENLDPTVPVSPLSRLIRKSAALLSGADYYYGTLLCDSDRIIVLSEHHKASLSLRYPKAVCKSVLIPPPPNMLLELDNRDANRMRGRQLLGLSDNEFLITYIGYIYPGKGLETLLKAFKLLNDKYPRGRLAIVGGEIAQESWNKSDYMRNIMNFTNQLDLAHKVKWTGEYSWNDPKTSEYILASDVCVLPFDTGVQLNNSSLSCVAAHGLPIISTRGDKLETPFVHGENIYLCPPKSPQLLAEAILNVIDKDDLRRRLKAGSIKLSHEWFSWETAIDKTIKLLKFNRRFSDHNGG